MFQTKSFLSCVASMVNSMRTRTTLITDYSEGGVARTMIEAPAQEIDELYQQMVAGIVEAVPVATYRSFSFDKLLATSAGGLVRVLLTAQPAQVIISAGVILSQPSSSVTYAATLDTVIPAGVTFADVPVSATTAGLNTNLLANTSFTVATPPAGFLSASNLVAFINGSDDETPTEQKTRFNSYIRTLARGTIAALQYGAKDRSYLSDVNGNIIERVAFVSVNEPYMLDSTQPPAWVRLYVHNGVGGTSAALVARVVQVLYGYYDSTGAAVAGFKAAGTKLDVAAATEQAVNIAGVLTAAAGYTKALLVTQATSKIATYIAGLDIGSSCIIAEITQLVMDIPGVFNFVLSGSPVDVSSTFSIKLMPGTIAVT